MLRSHNPPVGRTLDAAEALAGIAFYIKEEHKQKDERSICSKFNL